MGHGHRLSLQPAGRVRGVGIQPRPRGAQDHCAGDRRPRLLQVSHVGGVVLIAGGGGGSAAAVAISIVTDGLLLLPKQWYTSEDIVLFLGI